MKRVLVLTPTDIAGKLVMESFASGFEMNKCRVLLKGLQKLKEEDLKVFRPDMIFGYDYSFLAESKISKLIEKSECKNLVFYFAKDPKNSENKLYKKLKKLEATVFVWDKSFVKDFEKCFYLPLAASPLKYAIDFSGYKHVISFVGNPSFEKRQSLLSELVKIFKNQLSVFCQEEDFQKSVVEIKEKNLLEEDDLMVYEKSYKGDLKTEQELALVYNSSKINLDIANDKASSPNYRVFEALTSGGFLMTEDKKGLEKIFTPSKHLETYKNSTDLADKINFYLNNLNIAQRIAQLGRFACIEKHNFSARAKSILQQVF